MKKVFFALALLGALLCFSACSNSSGSGPSGGSAVWTYINQSSHTVTIIPQAASIPAARFEIPAGGTAIVTWLDAGQTTFSWWPFPEVKITRNEDAKTCYFTDNQ